MRKLTIIMVLALLGCDLAPNLVESTVGTDDSSGVLPDGIKEEFENHHSAWGYNANAGKLFKELLVDLEQKLADGRALEDLRLVISSVDLALERAESCDVEQLNEMYEGWGNSVRDDFVPGLRLRAQALRELESHFKENGDSGASDRSKIDLKSAKADALIGGHSKWFLENLEAIGAKLEALH